MASTRTKSALERMGLDLAAGRVADAARDNVRVKGARVRARGEALRRLRDPKIQQARDALKSARDALARNAKDAMKQFAPSVRKAGQSVRDAQAAYQASLARLKEAETLAHDTIKQGSENLSERVKDSMSRRPGGRVSRTTRFFDRQLGISSDAQAARSLATEAAQDVRKAGDALALARRNAVSTGKTARELAEGAYRPVVSAAEQNLASVERAALTGARDALRAGAAEHPSFFMRASGAVRQNILEPLRRGGEWFNRVTGGTMHRPFARRAAQSAAQSAPGKSWLLRGLSWAAHTQVGQALNPLNPQASAWVKKQLLRNVPGSGAVGSIVKGAAVNTARVVKAPVSVPAKLLSKEFELVGKGVGKIAGKNMAGRVLSRTFSAGGLAGGFALSAWTDAGLNAYDFFTSPEFKSRNWKNQMTLNVNGKTITTSDESGVMNAILNNKLEFARTYGTEVAKGIFRAATFGLVGSGDDTFLDRLADPGAEPSGRVNDQLSQGIDPRTGKYMVDENGNPLSPRDAAALAAEAKAAKKAQKLRTKFSRIANGMANDDDNKAYVTDEAAVRTTLREMQNERAKRLDTVRAMALNPLAYAAGSNRALKLFRSASERNAYEYGSDQYRQEWSNNFYRQRAANVDAAYDSWVSGLAKLAPAKRVMEANRLAAYKALTGSDIGQDEQLAAAQDAGAKARIDAFNADWSDAEFTDARRLDLDPRTLVNTPVESAGSAGAGGEN